MENQVNTYKHNNMHNQPQMSQFQVSCRQEREDRCWSPCKPSKPNKPSTVMHAQMITLDKQGLLLSLQLIKGCFSHVVLIRHIFSFNPARSCAAFTHCIYPLRTQAWHSSGSIWKEELAPALEGKSSQIKPVPGWDSTYSKYQHPC